MAAKELEADLRLWRRGPPRGAWSYEADAPAEVASGGHRSGKDGKGKGKKGKKGKRRIWKKEDEKKKDGDV